MRILKEYKAVALHLKNPGAVLDALPSARKVDDHVLVPFRDYETAVLNGMGIRVPPPILHYYDWPGRHKPMTHQLATSAFLCSHPRALCLNDIGTGKTLATLHLSLIHI